MSNILIVTGGEAPPLDYIEPLLEESCFIAAADSGLGHCRKWGVEPQLIMGDMDSLENPQWLDEYPREIVKAYPKDKDWSDTELVLKELEGRKGDLILLGGGEGRLDHSMAILALFQRAHHPLRWITGREDIRLICDRVDWQGWNNRTVSLFPLEDQCSFSSSGLKWELDHYEMTRRNFSLSNRMTGDRASILVHKGRGLLLLSLTSE